MIRDQVLQNPTTQPNLALHRSRHLFMIRRNNGKPQHDGRSIDKVMSAVTSLMHSTIPLIQTNKSVITLPSSANIDVAPCNQAQSMLSLASAKSLLHVNPQQAKVGLRLPEETTGISEISGTRALLVVDAENIVHGLYDVGLKFRFRDFRRHFAAMVYELDSHVYTTAPEALVQARHAFFQHAGFVPHIESIQTVETYLGTQTKANSDNQLLLGIAERASDLKPSFVILVTGDGDLGCSIAQFLANRSAPPKMYIASIQGATSSRHRTTNNKAVEGNIWIGLDLVQSNVKHLALV